MNDKREFLNLSKLPSEIIYFIWKRMDNEKDGYALVLVSNIFYNLIQPKRLANYLFMCLVKGEQNKATMVLQNSPSLALEGGKVRDHGGRFFKNISPYEYVLWSLNIPMARTMSKLLCQQAKINKKGKEIKEALFEQLNNLEISFNFKKEIYREKHFDIKQFLAILETYTTHFEDWSLSKHYKYWFNKIVPALNLIPTHMIQSYESKLDKKIFRPRLSWFIEKESSTSSKIEEKDIKLLMDKVVMNCLLMDLKAIKNAYEASEEDFKSFKQSLMSSIKKNHCIIC